VGLASLQGGTQSRSAQPTGQARVRHSDIHTLAGQGRMMAIVAELEHPNTRHCPFSCSTAHSAAQGTNTRHCPFSCSTAHSAA
jgi:hypothetical protein